ncbi:MAG: hypothetical protein HEEMFOPI_01807 [Holosporales bacterium]
MKKITYVLYIIIFSCFSLFSTEETEYRGRLLMALSSEMRDICLPDGMNIFGEKYEGNDPKFFDFSNISRNGNETHKHWDLLEKILEEPIYYIKTGFFSHEKKYHSVNEVVHLYNLMVSRLCQLDLSAINFFRLLFLDGKIQTTIAIQNLNAQKERSQLFNKLIDWRLGRILRNDPDVDALFKRNEERRSAVLKQKIIILQGDEKELTSHPESLLRERLVHGKTPSSPTISVH